MHLASDPLFQKNCAKCHGKTAEGRHFAGPSLIAPKATGMSKEELRNTIMNGKHRMPKFSDKLTADDIDRLVEEIKASDRK